MILTNKSSSKPFDLIFHSLIFLNVLAIYVKQISIQSRLFQVGLSSTPWRSLGAYWCRARAWATSPLLRKVIIAYPVLQQNRYYEAAADSFITRFAETYFDIASTI